MVAKLRWQKGQPLFVLLDVMERTYLMVSPTFGPASEAASRTAHPAVVLSRIRERRNRHRGRKRNGNGNQIVE